MTLKDDIASDADTFFDTDEFAEDIEYNGASVKAIVESISERVANTVAAATLQIIVQSTDISQPAIDDRVLYDGTYYRVGQGAYMTGLDWNIPLIRDYIEV